MPSLNGKLDRAEEKLTAVELRQAEVVAPTWLYYPTEAEAATAQRLGLIPRGCKVYIAFDPMEDV